METQDGRMPFQGESFCLQASFYIQGQDMHLVVTDFGGASLESQNLQLLPGVTTLPSEPPQLPQEVSGFAPQGPACLQEEHSREKAEVAECSPPQTQMLVKTGEEPTQVSAPREWPHPRLAQRTLCENLAQEMATGLINQDTCEEIGQGIKTS